MVPAIRTYCTTPRRCRRGGARSLRGAGRPWCPFTARACCGSVAATGSAATTYSDPEDFRGDYRGGRGGTPSAVRRTANGTVRAPGSTERPTVGGVRRYRPRGACRGVHVRCPAGCTDAWSPVLVRCWWDARSLGQLATPRCGVAVRVRHAVVLSRGRRSSAVPSATLSLAPGPQAWQMVAGRVFLCPGTVAPTIGRGGVNTP